MRGQPFLNETRVQDLQLAERIDDGLIVQLALSIALASAGSVDLNVPTGIPSARMRPTMATLATTRYQRQSADACGHELTRETPGLHSKSDNLVDHHVRLQHPILHPQELSHTPSANAHPARGAITNQDCHCHCNDNVHERTGTQENLSIVPL